MLSSYVNAIFAVPENPVMRAVSGYQVMPTAGSGLQALQKGGLGCACGVKPFGLGNVNDEGLRLYGDFYGAQQHGGMRLNGDPAGLGTYFGKGQRGMGALEDFTNNLLAGNIGEALGGNDFSATIPNAVVVIGAIWLISTLGGQFNRGRKGVGAFADRVDARRSARTEYRAKLKKIK